MGINDDNFVPPRSHNYIDLDLNIFSSHQCSNPHMITIKRTEENTLQFYTIRTLQEQNKNLKSYSKRLIEHANSEKQVMQNLLKQREKRQALLDEQLAFHQQTFVENIDDLVYLRNVIENLKERLMNFGEESSVREIIHGEEKVPNEE